MTSRYNRRVIFVLEGCRSKINQSNFSIQKNFSLPSLAADCL